MRVPKTAMPCRRAGMQDRNRDLHVRSGGRSWLGIFGRPATSYVMVGMDRGQGEGSWSYSHAGCESGDDDM